LSKLNCDWAWLVCDQVLQCSSGNVVIEQNREIVTI
jgi:hypothetical protein